MYCYSVDRAVSRFLCVHVCCVISFFTVLIHGRTRENWIFTKTSIDQLFFLYTFFLNCNDIKNVFIYIFEGRKVCRIQHDGKKRRVSYTHIVRTYKDGVLTDGSGVK